MIDDQMPHTEMHELTMSSSSLAVNGFLSFQGTYKKNIHKLYAHNVR